jgi:hypothetical protein
MEWTDKFSRWAVMTYQKEGMSSTIPVMFSYDSATGVTISLVTTWTMERGLNNVMFYLNGLGHVHIASLAFKSENIGLGTGLREYTYSARVCVELDYKTLHTNQSMDFVQTIYLPLEFEQEFIGDSPLTQTFHDTGKGVTVRAENKTRLKGYLGLWDARVELELAHNTEWQADTGITLKPVATLIVSFEQLITRERALEHVEVMMDWTDFLSLRPLSGTRFTLSDDQKNMLRFHRADRVKHRTGAGGFPGSFALRLEQVLEDYGLMLENALEIGRNSRAWDEFMLLLQHPDLPFRERLYTSLRALEGWSREHRAPKSDAFTDHLLAYRKFWERLEVLDLGKYLALVQNTRNDISHISKPQGSILREQDQWRLHLQTIALIRAAMVERLGLPEDLILEHFDRMLEEIRSRFGEWDPDAYQIQHRVKLD